MKLGGQDVDNNYLDSGMNKSLFVHTLLNVSLNHAALASTLSSTTGHGHDHNS
jgi:hypothetical protein